MSKHSVTRRLTHFDLAGMKAAGEKIAMLTCYDASFAQACDAAGVDSILVGDSLGMVVQGHDSTLPVTVEHVAYHIACVARGCSRPLIIGDLPFGSFQESPQAAYRNAVTLMAAGAQMVKLEGGVEMAETTRFLTSRGIPVCAHIGLTPQSVHQLGGYRVQGKDEAGAAQLLADAHAHEDAGASLIVLASDHLSGWASASRYTKGLSSEPTGRRASTARLNPGSVKSRLPTTASTSPLCTSVITMPASSGGRPLLPIAFSVRVTAPSAYPCADGDIPLITLSPAPEIELAG